jgi:hypothetical protein
MMSLFKMLLVGDDHLGNCKHAVRTEDSFESKPLRRTEQVAKSKDVTQTRVQRSTPQKSPSGKASAGRNTGLYDNSLTVDYKGQRIVTRNRLRSSGVFSKKVRLDCESSSK